VGLRGCSPRGPLEPSDVRQDVNCKCYSACAGTVQITQTRTGA